MSAAAAMEHTLTLLADRDIQLRHGLYERFFARFPDRRAAFLCPEASSIRMTDETLQLLYGLAGGETWVWPMVAELIYTHRAYGALPLREYEAFIDMVVEELEAALGERWTAEEAIAWGEQAAALKAMIGKAQAEWDQVLPRG